MALSFETVKEFIKKSQLLKEEARKKRKTEGGGKGRGKGGDGDD